MGPELLLFASAAMGGLSAASQAQQQRANLDFQADIARRNARQAQLNAQVREQRARRAAERQAGRTRAAFGASGVQLGEGTPIDVLADQAAELEQQILLERFGGEQQAARFGLQSRSLRNQASQIDPITSGLMAGGQTLLSGAAMGAFSGGGGMPSFGASPSGAGNAFSPGPQSFAIA